MTFVRAFQGNEHHRGITANGKYPHYLEKNKPFNHEEHLKGIRSQGLSPLRQKTNEDEAYCILGGMDFDFEKIPPAKNFCQFIDKTNNELFVFESKSSGYHVYWFANDWVKAAKMKAAMERLKKKINPTYKVDRMIPYETKLKDIKAQCGFWFNAPYFANTRRCLNHLGEPLTLEQFELKYKLRKHHYLSSIVGWKAAKKGTGKMGRHQVLFRAALYQKYRMTGQEDILKELNNSFDPPITEQGQIDHALDTEGYDEEHLNNNLENYFKEIGIEEKTIEEAPPNFWEGAEEFEDHAFNNKKEEPKKLIGYDIRDYRKLPIEKPVFIMERLFKERSINNLFGPKGNFKTEYALGIAYAMAHGGTFLKYKAPVCYPVLYVDGEMDPYDIIEREAAYLEAFGEPPKDHLHIINFAHQTNQIIPDIKDPLGQELILNYLREQEKLVGIKPFLILDNLRSLSNYNENESDSFRPIGTWLKNLRGLGYASLTLDHTGHNQDHMRGTSSKSDWANVCLKIQTEGKKGKKFMKVRLKFDKARGLKPDETDDFIAVYDFQGNWTLGQSEKEHDDDLLKKQIKEFLMKKPQPTQKNIALYLKISAGKVNKLIKEIDDEPKDSKSNEVPF
jgi:putative DNA primase/helicase